MKYNCDQKHDEEREEFAMQQDAKSFELESGIPVTSSKRATRHEGYKKPKFPFSKMKTGDSFVVRPSDCEDAPLIVVQNIVSSAAYQFSQGFYWKFTTRQVGGKFVRVWRVS